VGEAPSHLWRTRTADVAPHADVIHAPEGAKIPWGERWATAFPGARGPAAGQPGWSGARPLCLWPGKEQAGPPTVGIRPALRGLPTNGHAL